VGMLKNLLVIASTFTGYTNAGIRFTPILRDFSVESIACGY
jgi:hypothetical protein